MNFFEKTLSEVAKGFITQILSYRCDNFHARDADISVFPIPVSVAVINTPSDNAVNHFLCTGLLIIWLCIYIIDILD